MNNLNRTRKMFYDWKDLRNEICHTPGGYAKYIAKVATLFADFEFIRTTVKKIMVEINDFKKTLHGAVSFIEKMFTNSRAR
jgi:hypothetical protein